MQGINTINLFVLACCSYYRFTNLNNSLIITNFVSLLWFLKFSKNLTSNEVGDIFSSVKKAFKYIYTNIIFEIGIHCNNDLEPLYFQTLSLVINIGVLG
jgi:hypothetical protein